VSGDTTDLPRYMTDEQICRELGIARKRWRAMARVLAIEGLPEPDPLIGKRSWPAVRAFFDRRDGLSNTLVPSRRDGKEKLDAL
jgi:hypothetical protein